MTDLGYRKQALFWGLLTLILFSSLAFSGYGLGEPLWDGGHHGFHMSEYPHNARNYLRFGYLESKLGLVMNYGQNKPTGPFHYRIDHPMLLPFVSSLGYQLFGIHEWSGRLFPWLFALGSSVLVYLLAQRLTHNRWVALLAMFFVALSPIQLYYARLVAPHHLSTFFSLLAFYFYWQWFTSQRSIYFASMFGALIMGVYADWVAYFAFAPLIAHYLIFWPTERNWRLVVGLLCSPLLLFASYLLWTYWLLGDRAGQVLWNLFLHRSQSGDNLEREIWGLFYERSLYWLTLPVALLSLGWFIGFGWMVAKRQVSASQSLIFALFLFALSHNLLFADLVYVHDFAMIYHLAPATAIAAACAFSWLIGSYRPHSKILWGLTTTAIGLLFIAQSLDTFSKEHSHEPSSTQAYYLGQALKHTVSESGRYIDAADLYNQPGTGALRAYVMADRAYSRADTLDQFMTLMSDKQSYEAIVVANSDQSDPLLRQYLIEQYPRQEVAGFSIFDLQQSDSTVLVRNPSIEKPYQIEFGESFEFLGFNVQEVVPLKEMPRGWREKYLTRYPELLPDYQTRFRVVTFWRKTKEDATNYTLLTQFTSDIDQAKTLERKREGLDRLYATSLWPVGQIVRDEFEITAPNDLGSLKYDMMIGVKNEDHHLAPKGCDVIPTEDQLVNVDQIEITARSAEPLPEADTIRRATDVELEKGPLLIGIEQTDHHASPDELLHVTLIWCTITPIEQNYKVFVHLVDSEGRVITQDDAEPDQWQQPTSQWLPETPIRDPHPLLIPTDVSAGVYQIQVGMYSADTIERLSVLSSSELSQNNMVKMGEVEILSGE